MASQTELSKARPKTKHSKKVATSSGYTRVGEELAAIAANLPKNYPNDKVRLSTDTIGKIIDVHRMLDRLFHYYFKQYNITSIQIPVLMTLVKHKKLMVSQLAGLLHIGSSNITPLCKRLEKAGLITRTRDTEDQRVVYVSLTDTAIDMMNEISFAISHLNDIEDELYRIDDTDVRTIVTGIDVLNAYVSRVLFDVTGSLES